MRNNYIKRLKGEKTAKQQSKERLLPSNFARQVIVRTSGVASIGKRSFPGI